MSEDIDTEEIKEEKEPVTRRGRPRKIDLPEEPEDVIESIEEVVEANESESKVITGESREKAETMQETKPEEAFKVTTDDIVHRPIENKISHSYKTEHTPHSINYKYCVGEDVYLAHFSGDNSEKIFDSIIEKYIFRPFKTKIKEILIMADHTISYRLESCTGCFKESLVTYTQEECQKICDRLNLK